MPKRSWSQVPRSVWAIVVVIEVFAVWVTQGIWWALSIPAVGLVVGLTIRAVLQRTGRLPPPD
jgi:hypothetical protein